VWKRSAAATLFNLKLGGMSTSTPQNYQIFTAADILEHIASQLPSKSAKCTLTSHAPAQATGDIEGGTCASPTSVVLSNLDLATATLTLAGTASNIRGLA